MWGSVRLFVDSGFRVFSLLTYGELGLGLKNTADLRQASLSAFLHMARDSGFLTSSYNLVLIIIRVSRRPGVVQEEIRGQRRRNRLRVARRPRKVEECRQVVSGPRIGES
jgi:hypothetical protein